MENRGFDKTIGADGWPIDLYQTAETLTHLHHRPRPSKPPISHWTTVRFCNGCPSGGVRSMSQGLRVLVLGDFLPPSPLEESWLRHTTTRRDALAAS